MIPVLLDVVWNEIQRNVFLEYNIIG